MARNRQRARERKRQKLHRENVPGSLDNASADVEAVEARIVAGADGIPAEEFDDDDARLAAEAEQAFGEEERHPARSDGAAAPARHGAGGRLVNFIRACWAELQRVQWPDRRQVGQATAVVIGFVIVAGAFLGLADIAAQKLVDFIL